MVLRVLSLVRSAALYADEVHLMSARAELPDLTETLSAIAAFVRSQGLWREEAAERPAVSHREAQPGWQYAKCAIDPLYPGQMRDRHTAATPFRRPNSDMRTQLASRKAPAWSRWFGLPGQARS
jgi:hypothetical protein